MNQKIVNITTSTYHPKVNGLSLVVQQNVKALLSLGFEVNVFTCNGSLPIENEKIFTYNIIGNGRIFNGIKGEIDKYINDLEQESNSVILNIHHAWNAWNTNLALQNRHRLSNKQIVYSHGIGFDSLESWPRKKLRNILYYKEKIKFKKYISIIDGIIFLVDNKAHPRCFDQKIIDLSIPQFIIPNPVIERSISRTDNDVLIEKKIIDFLKGNEKVVLNISNFEKIKNQKLLLEILTTSKLKFKIVLVGSEKTYYSKKIEQLIKQHGFDDRVLILYKISDHNTKLLLETADFFAFTSLNDFVPLVLIEAIKFGLPFISFKTADISIQGGHFCSYILEYKTVFQNLINFSNKELSKIGEQGKEYYFNHNANNYYLKNIENFVSFFYKKKDFE